MSADPARHAATRPPPTDPRGPAASRGPLRLPPDRDTEACGRARQIGALLALLVGGLASVALAEAVLEPARSTVPLLVAAFAMTSGAAIALGLRLRGERRAAAALAARIEAFEDANWEMEEASAGIPTGGVASGFEPALTIATVSHELRAPLHGMQGLTDLLAETSLSAEQRAYVDALGQSTAALGRVVEDLLDASRIATGHFALERSATAIEPLLEQVAELMAPRAFAKQIGLATRVAPGLPPVEADGGRLRQVLINLVANAISFSDSGGVVLAAERLSGDGPRVRLRFSVTDTGRGVEPADRARIFGSFERAAEGGGGAGLGLAISSRILDRMGARLALAPRRGGGSVFSFELDLPAAGEAIPASPALAGRRILVALAAEPEGRALAETIAAEGGEAAVASTQAAAAGLLGAAAAAGQAFDALLVDAHLLGEAEPALARFREVAGRALPVVVMIEPGERSRIDALRDTGFDAYLVRPVRRSSLTRVLAEAAGRGAFIVDPTDRPDAAAAPRGRRPLRTLVVEDDPVSALLIRAVLEKLGHEVAEASSLKAAEDAIAGMAADLVFVDLRLGGEDGAALLRSVHAAKPGRPRPFLIAMSAAEAMFDAGTVGADLAITKPISPDSLRRAVAAASGSDAA